MRSLRPLRKDDSDTERVLSELDSAMVAKQAGKQGGATGTTLGIVRNKLDQLRKHFADYEQLAEVFGYLGRRPARRRRLNADNGAAVALPPLAMATAGSELASSPAAAAKDGDGDVSMDSVGGSGSGGSSSIGGIDTATESKRQQSKDSDAEARLQQARSDAHTANARVTEFLW